jgi:hypothetical protein
VSDEQDRPGLPAPWSEALRRLRELGEQVTAAGRAAAAAGAKATPPVLARPLAAYAEQLLQVSAAITNPLQELLEEQQRLVERMAEWAEQHRLMSEQVARWAQQQREMSEHVAALADPFLDQVELLETLSTEWRRRVTDPRA